MSILDTHTPAGRQSQKMLGIVNLNSSSGAAGEELDASIRICVGSILVPLLEESYSLYTVLNATYLCMCVYLYIYIIF